MRSQDFFLTIESKDIYLSDISEKLENQGYSLKEEDLNVKYFACDNRGFFLQEKKVGLVFEVKNHKAPIEIQKEFLDFLNSLVFLNDMRYDNIEMSAYISISQDENSFFIFSHENEKHRLKKGILILKHDEDAKLVVNLYQQIIQVNMVCLERDTQLTESANKLMKRYFTLIQEIKFLNQKEQNA